MGGVQLTSEAPRKAGTDRNSAHPKACGLTSADKYHHSGWPLSPAPVQRQSFSQFYAKLQTSRGEMLRLTLTGCVMLRASNGDAGASFRCEDFVSSTAFSHRQSHYPHRNEVAGLCIMLWGPTGAPKIAGP